MRIYVIIPAHNEESFLNKTLDSLVKQSRTPERLLVVDDNSTDQTAQIALSYSDKYNWIDTLSISSEVDHRPGGKVVNAFNQGLKSLDNDYDLICKFDADLIFPEDYIETIESTFIQDPAVGMAGGLLYIKKGSNWVYESIADKNHIRGPIKAYRKGCFEAIGGLRPSVGWDTVDVLLAQYFGWKVTTIHSLKVKHLKPTGKKYSAIASAESGKAFYRMRYGFLLSAIALLKGSVKRGKLSFFIDGLKGYLKSKSKNEDFLVKPDEGRFIRNLRWKGIRRKFF